MSEILTELPPLPKPELTCWYGPSSEFYEEPMFTADQMREYARAAVLMERERCAKLCEQLAEKGPGNWKHGTPGDCAAAIRKVE